MTEQIRINRIELGQTLGGKPVVHLFAPGAQYARFPVLYLFDPGLLVQVGIDPNSLEPGEDVHVNLWAHYEISEKTNAKGNPYKDVISLEQINAPATTTSTDTSAILAELRAIKALLLDLATSSPPPAAAAPDPNVDPQQARRVHALNQAGRSTDAKSCGSTADPQATEPEPEPELSEAEARTEFYTLAGPAITAGTDPAAVNDLARSANGEGWNGALAGLKALLAGH